MSGPSWSPEEYQRRQRAGLCAWCPEPRGRWTLCAKHREYVKEWCATNRETARAEKRCQWGKCPEPAGGASYCTAHAARRRSTRRDVVRHNARSA